jgi:hypothetical protein
MTRAIVCGGRHFQERAYLFWVMDTLHRTMRFSLIVQGGQKFRDKETHDIIAGADYWALEWSRWRGVRSATEAAQWVTADGEKDRSAGPRRNQLMLDKYHPDVVIAFPGGRGTASMTSLAIRARVPVVEIPFHPRYRS